MPEGDVVRLTAGKLDAALAGRVLSRGELRWGSLGDVSLAGATVLRTSTIGKHLLTRLDDGRTLRTHLRMDGNWRVTARGGPSRLERSPWVRVVLGTGEHTCWGVRLGMVDLVATRDEHLLIGHLGPDVLQDDADLAEAGRRIADQGERPIGEVLLDQRVVAGLGTIYMAETLWHHGIWPWTHAAGTDGEQLVTTARRLMLRSVASGTPTATGSVTRRSNVHERRGQECPRCAEPIRRGEIGPPDARRPVFWCPRCQAGPP